MTFWAEWTAIERKAQRERTWFFIELRVVQYRWTSEQHVKWKCRGRKVEGWWGGTDKQKPSQQGLWMAEKGIAVCTPEVREPLRVLSGAGNWADRLLHCPKGRSPSSAPVVLPPQSIADTLCSASLTLHQRPSHPLLACQAILLKHKWSKPVPHSKFFGGLRIQLMWLLFYTKPFMFWLLPTLMFNPSPKYPMLNLLNFSPKSLCSFHTCAQEPGTLYLFLAAFAQPFSLN